MSEIAEYDWVDLGRRDRANTSEWESTTVTRSPEQLAQMVSDGWKVIIQRQHEDGLRCVALITRRRP